MIYDPVTSYLRNESTGKSPSVERKCLVGLEIERKPKCCPPKSQKFIFFLKTISLHFRFYFNINSVTEFRLSITPHNTKISSPLFCFTAYFLFSNLVWFCYKQVIIVFKTSIQRWLKLFHFVGCLDLPQFFPWGLLHRFAFFSHS